MKKYTLLAAILIAFLPACAQFEAFATKANRNPTLVKAGVSLVVSETLIHSVSEAKRRSVALQLFNISKASRDLIGGTPTPAVYAAFLRKYVGSDPSVAVVIAAVSDYYRDSVYPQLISGGTNSVQLMEAVASGVEASASLYL